MGDEVELRLWSKLRSGRDPIKMAQYETSNVWHSSVRKLCIVTKCLPFEDLISFRVLSGNAS